MKRFSWFAIFCCLGVFSLWCVETRAAPQSGVLPFSIVQRNAIRDITRQAGKPLTMPAFSGNARAWVSERRRNFGSQTQMYTQIGEELLVLQKLLNHKDLEQRREGLRLVRHIDLFITQKLRDRQLRARLYEGFVLPYLSSGDWEMSSEINRARLAERAVSAFSQANERNNEIRALYRVIDQRPNQNTRDWALGQLALAYAAKGEYAKAAGNLRRIQTTTMRIRNLIPEYEAKAKTAKNQSSTL